MANKWGRQVSRKRGRLAIINGNGTTRAGNERLGTNGHASDEIQGTFEPELSTPTCMASVENFFRNWGC